MPVAKPTACVVAGRPVRSASASVDRAVAAELLCVGLFEHQDPERAARRVRVDGLAVAVREAVVDPGRRRPSADEPSHAVDARRGRLEHRALERRPRALRERGERREEVAVAQPALLDVLGLYVALDDAPTGHALPVTAAAGVDDRVLAPRRRRCRGGLGEKRERVDARKVRGGGAAGAAAGVEARKGWHRSRHGGGLLPTDCDSRGFTRQRPS